MVADDLYRLTLYGDEELQRSIKSLAQLYPDAITIESTRVEKDATRWGFELVTVAAVVTIVTGVLYAGELAAKIYQALRDGKSNKVIIQTPFKTLEVRYAEDLKEDDVRKILKAAQSLD